MSLVRKRSVTIRGHRTSFSLEKPFYDDLVAIAYPQIHALARGVVELLEIGKCDVPHGEPLFHLRAEFQEAQPQLILAAVESFDEAAWDDCVEDAVHGGRREPHLRGQIPECNGGVVFGQEIEEAHQAVDDLDS